MGVNLTTLKYFHEMCKKTGRENLAGRTLVELGNLYIRPDAQEYLKLKKLHPFKIAMEYFKHLGLKVFCIDINGKDGAVPYDLSKPIITSQQFDILLNGGTTEHVSDQYECFRNVHNLCKKDAMMIHIVPEKGSWPKHCPHHYTIDFFEKLCFHNNYILFNSRTHYRSGSLRGYLLYRTLIKREDMPFVSKDIFKEIRRDC